MKTWELNTKGSNQRIIGSVCGQGYEIFHQIFDSMSVYDLNDPINATIHQHQVNDYVRREVG